MVLLEREYVVVQEGLSYDPQSIAASGTARGQNSFKIFILLVALKCVGKRYHMTKAVMEA